MNRQSSYEGPTLEQFFAEAEMEDEFGRRGGARQMSFRRPAAAFRRSIAPRRRPPAARRPGKPFRLRPHRKIRPRPRFPIMFPIPAVLDPSLWPSQPPPQQQQPGAAAPPAPTPVEPPDVTGAEPPDAAAAEPTDAGADALPDEDAEPTEELLEFFEFPHGEYGMQRRHGRNGGHQAPAICNCGRAQSTEFGSSELLSEFFEQPEGTFGESEFSLTDLPQSVLGLFRSGLETAGLKLAITFGYRDETQLTNVIFNVRHPERLGRSISAAEPNYSSLAREWLSIRDTVVRPALRGSTATPSTPSVPAAPAGTGGLDIVNVRGIHVARQIAPQVDRLLGAAAAAGIRLSGGGFRSPAKQIELRRKHCGPTEWDIYKKPSSQCNPPTATPGKSNHEKGLAIDFTYNGSTIKTRDNPAFKWLAANAANFGLYNLPSEPWHWSINGK